MSVVLRETRDEGSPNSSSTSAGFDEQSQSQKTIENYSRRSSTVCEIEIEEEQISSELFEISNITPMPSIREEVGGGGDGSLFSFDSQNGEDVVYVAVGKSQEESSSMDALLWTLNHVANPDTTLVFLIHIFPELRYIPTPLGKLPISQVNPKQKENYLIQERSKITEFLQKFLDVCSTSKVKVDTILIESDMEAKALLDLIPIFNIRKLVMGTHKSNLRKLRSRRGSGIADQVLQNAPEFCEIKIICEGKEVVIDYDVPESPSPRGNVDSPKLRASTQEERVQSNDSFGCTCFKPKVIA